MSHYIISNLILLKRFEPHWGIKRFIRRIVRLLDEVFLLPLEVLFVYHLSRVLGHSSMHTFLQQLRSGKVEDSDIGYSRRLAVKVIHLEQQIMGSEPVCEEVNILRQLLRKPAVFADDAITLIDLGSAAGIKGVQVIQMLQQRNLHIVLYIALDSQELLANEAARYVHYHTGVRTEKYIGDILKINQIRFSYNKKSKPFVLFLGNTYEIFDLQTINRVIGLLAKRSTILLGVRYRRRGSNGIKDVTRLKQYYNQWPPYLLERIPKRFQAYVSLSHKWEESRSRIRLGIKLKTSKIVNRIMGISDNKWIQIGEPMRFRTLTEIEENLRPFCRVIAKRYHRTQGNIQHQMVMFVLRETRKTTADQ